MDLGLKGKIALVTGASEGIGRGIAQKLAEEGVQVAICARTASRLQETAAAITHATGMEIVPIPADLRTLAGCQSFVEQAATRLGGIDILVNNAGASAFGAFVDLPDEAFVDAIHGKLLGYIRCTKAAIPHMQRRGGGAIVGHFNPHRFTLPSRRNPNVGAIFARRDRIFDRIFDQRLEQ